MAVNFLTRRLNSVLSIVPSRSHYGYLPFEGRIPNDKSEKAVNKANIKAINLKPIKRMHFKIDPLHRRSGSIRRLMTLMSNEKIIRTGVKTAIKYDFVSDRSDPEVTLTFHDNDKKAIFQMSYLTEHEMVAEMNKIVLPLVKKDIAVEIDTKDKKKSGGAGKKKK